MVRPRSRSRVARETRGYGHDAGIMFRFADPEEASSLRWTIADLAKARPSRVPAVIALRPRPIEARGSLEVSREPRQRVGEHGPILCSDLRRVAKLVSETEESIFDTGFRVTSRLDEPNEPHRCRVAVALSSYARLPRCRRPTQQSHSGSQAPGSGTPRPATIGHQAPQRSREGLK